MLSELLRIFRADNPLHTMGASFKEMLPVSYTHLTLPTILLV